MFELYQYHQAQHPPTPTKFKYGAAGTTWNLLPFDWWQPWKQFAQFHLSPQAQMASNHSRRPISPGHIHNQTLMRKMGSNQLQPNLLCGEDYEVRICTRMRLRRFPLTHELLRASVEWT